MPLPSRSSPVAHDHPPFSPVRSGPNAPSKPSRQKKIPSSVQENDLVSQFTTGTIEGWRPVDDVTLTDEDFGFPSMGLKADDWRDGSLFRIASPIEWAGDWSDFQLLSFDMHWSGSLDDPPHQPLVTIFGANGDVLTYDALPQNDIWIHREIQLTPATFGVDQAFFDGVMAFVSHIWIAGEFGTGDDNIRVSSDPTPTPKVFETSLISRFGSDPEGWGVVGNGNLVWDETAGFTGGAITTADGGSGIQRFHSPDAWSGDWSNFSTLRFMLKTLGKNQADLDFELWIMTWDGTALYLTYPSGPWRSWTPYSIDLTPGTFNVTPAEFETVMSDVAYLWIVADLVNGTGSIDTTGLDEVSLVSSDTISQPPPDKFSSFDLDGEAWHNGGRSGNDWEFNSSLPTWYELNGNPGGFIANTDVGDTAYWFTPETWAGDWRGYQSVSFDQSILNGTSILEDRVGLSIASIWGNLDAEFPMPPTIDSWTHYEFPLTPAAFGVTQEKFDTIMRVVMSLSIRSEWINGSEEEGLDNVRVTKTSDACLAWITVHITDPNDIANETVAEKFADPDHDGNDNWTEFLAQTIPVDSASYLLLGSPVKSDGSYTVSFQTHPGRTYQLERSTTLLTGSWTPVGTALVRDGVLHHVEDVTGEPQVFYRLMLWPTDIDAWKI
ncbi:MAG: hypothetical protein ACJAVK_002335 [Akkermansiaceae bacterium]|jgi:hypothetical protein